MSNGTPTRWLRLAAIVVFASSLAACSTIRNTLQPAASSSPPAPMDATARAALLQHALDLLQSGNAKDADVTSYHPFALKCIAVKSIQNRLADGPAC